MRQVCDLHTTAAEAAAETLARLRLNYTNDLYLQLGATQLQLLKDLNVRSVGISIAGIARHAVTPLLQAYSSARIAAEMAQSFPRTDVAAMGVAALRDIDFGKVRGNSIATAFAAFQIEHGKGFESLRASFAGIAADALKQGLVSLNQRDEEAFPG